MQSSSHLYDPEAYALKGRLAKPLDTKGAEQIVFPDLHGNALTFLMRLELLKILRLKRDLRIRLAEIYQDSGSLTRLPLEDQNKVLSIHDRDQFRGLLGTAKIVDHEKLRHLLLLGDVVGDRGRNDVLTMLVLEKLWDEHVNYNSLFGNHDWELVLWRLFHQNSNVYLISSDQAKGLKSNVKDIYLYKGPNGICVYNRDGQILLPSKAQAFFNSLPATANLFVQPENNPTKCDVPEIRSAVINGLYSLNALPRNFDASQSVFRSSLDNLIRFVEDHPEEQEWVNQLIDKVYLSKLKLFDYSLSVKTPIPRIREFTHAPAGTEAVQAFANYYLIPYDDSTPEKFFAVIDQINAKFTEQLLNKTVLPVAPGHHGLLFSELFKQLNHANTIKHSKKPPLDNNKNLIIDPNQYFFYYLANNRTSAHLKGLSHQNAKLNNTHGHTGHLPTPWNTITNPFISGESLDFENYLGHMTGVYGTPCDNLCSLLNKDEFLSMDLKPLALQESKAEFKGPTQPLNPSEMLRQIKNEIETTDWIPPAGQPGGKIILANHDEKIVPNKLAKIWNIINNKPSTVSDEVLLTQIQDIMTTKITTSGQRLGMWSHTAVTTDPLLEKFYAKFNKGGAYAAVELPPIAKIHMPPGTGNP